MIYLAHNGVDHGTAAESLAHEAMNPLLAGVIISILVGALIVIAIRGIRRFTAIPLPIEEDEEQQ